MAIFRQVAPRSVRWEAEGGVGLEHLTVAPDGAGFAVESVVIGGRGGRPYGVAYSIPCDPGWRVRSVRIRATDGRGCALSSSDSGVWLDPATGETVAGLHGCIDIDLAGTPFTNSLPIRRLDLEEGASADLSMLYVPFDSFTPRLDRQRYTCLAPGELYRYEAIDRDWSVELAVDEDGLVLGYPGLFRRLP